MTWWIVLQLMKTTIANIYPRRAPVSEWAIEIRRAQGEKSSPGKEQELGDDRARRWRRRRRRRRRRNSHAVHLPLWWRVGKIAFLTYVEGEIHEGHEPSLY